MIDNDAIGRNENVLFALRTAARVEVDALIARQLKNTADAIQTVLLDFANNPTPELMVALQGQFTRAFHYMTIRKGATPPPSPISGAGEEGARLAA